MWKPSRPPMRRQPSPTPPPPGPDSVENKHPLAGPAGSSWLDSRNDNNQLDTSPKAPPLADTRRFSAQGYTSDDRLDLYLEQMWEAYEEEMLSEEEAKYEAQRQMEEELEFGFDEEEDPDHSMRSDLDADSDNLSDRLDDDTSDDSSSNDSPSNLPPIGLQQKQEVIQALSGLKSGYGSFRSSFTPSDLTRAVESQSWEYVDHVSGGARIGALLDRLKQSIILEDSDTEIERLHDP
ncbi:uncharacterized protein LOC62_05G006847 [Vanrija pseudolonga]|uniref:Uncharacterized protein n=1 Tax=Vanrija pseudolonga TaxID=143232 RepID=A0AAF0YGC0_9TREE|nr:hypothetical protein LOC62_05G006847 [Vanrija pseudolonga]